MSQWTQAERPSPFFAIACQPRKRFALVAMGFSSPICSGIEALRRPPQHAQDLQWDSLLCCGGRRYLL